MFYRFLHLPYPLPPPPPFTASCTFLIPFLLPLLLPLLAPSLSPSSSPSFYRFLHLPYRRKEKDTCEGFEYTRREWVWCSTYTSHTCVYFGYGFYTYTSYTCVHLRHATKCTTLVRIDTKACNARVGS